MGLGGVGGGVGSCIVSGRRRVVCGMIGDGLVCASAKFVVRVDDADLVKRKRKVSR